VGKQLLIFDFDGTIADTTPLHASAFERVLSPLGITVHYPSIAGMKTADAISRCATEFELELTADQITELQIAKQAAVRELIDLEVLPILDADYFLRWAKKRYHLSIATSGSRGTVELSLDKLGFTGWFEPLVCADDVERAKPYPDCFLKVLSLTGYQPNQALIFEDSEAGLAAAEAAGISCIQINKISWTELKSQIQ
jgi:sugar-phosphatase